MKFGRRRKDYNGAALSRILSLLNQTAHRLRSLYWQPNFIFKSPCLNISQRALIDSSVIVNLLIGSLQTLHSVHPDSVEDGDHVLAAGPDRDRLLAGHRGRGLLRLRGRGQRGRRHRGRQGGRGLAVGSSYYSS